MKKFSALTVIVLCSVQLYAQNKFLSFSDVHFDPYYDSTLFGQLSESDYTQWEKIFATSRIKLPSAYGDDSNYPLLISSLTDMVSRIPDPDFIIITGDFMSHDFNERFFHFSKSTDTTRLYDFIEKTIRFVTSTIIKYYPDELIFPSLGNDDANCGNYMVDPGGKFLEMIADAWKPLVNRSGINSNFQKDFSKGGYCMLNVPDETNCKLIVLNTIYFSINYVNSCGNQWSDPGMDELNWLYETLLNCKMNNEKVWLYFHIPPGVDIYGTIHGKGNCENMTVNSYLTRYNEEFISILKKFSDVINASFAGHFHRDDFRLLYKDYSPASFISISSSVSPVYYNNPSYKVFTYDKKDFTLQNYDSYYLDRTDANNTAWKFLYNFDDAYKQNGINAKSFENIFRLVDSDSLIRENYIKAYTSNASTFTKDLSNWFYNWCGMVHLSENDYGDCLCNQMLLKR